NAYPCKYEGPSFTAGDSNMANETLELVHEGITRVQ
ncbi:MAG: phage tail protein, partial [Cyanobacteria bacterium P01_D01_bin.2]